MDLILLAAGASTRYNTPRPKFWLTMYDGRFMLEHAIDPFLDQVETIHVVVQVEHALKFNVIETLDRIYGARVRVVCLNQLLNGPAQSAAAALEGISDREIFIKDCDSIFKCKLSAGNFVCTLAGQADPGMSYVVVNHGVIQDIAEKTLISDIACVGGYGFSSSQEFVAKVKNMSVAGEIFVSDIVKQIADVRPCAVSDYHDLGDLDKFIRFNRQHQTIFCDIDGVVVENQSEFFPPLFSDEPVLIADNCKRLLELESAGAEIVFTTARPAKFHNDIEAMLRKIGFTRFKLIAGLHHSQRVLINDFNVTNPDPSACAVNLVRNSDNLRDYL